MRPDNVLIVLGSDLVVGDQVCNLGLITSVEPAEGVFLTVLLQRHRWDLSRGVPVSVETSVIYHQGDEVAVYRR